MFAPRFLLRLRRVRRDRPPPVADACSCREKPVLKRPSVPFLRRDFSADASSKDDTGAAKVLRPRREHPPVAVIPPSCTLPCPTWSALLKSDRWRRRLSASRPSRRSSVGPPMELPSVRSREPPLNPVTSFSSDEFHFTPS